MSQATLISTLGVSLLLLAFLGSSLNRITQDSPVYWLLNILGGVLAAIGAALIGSVPFMILEAVWVLASVVGWVKWKRNRKPIKDD